MKKTLMSMALVGLMAGSMFAGPKQRANNQQERIGQGVKSGQLTAGETGRLENKERSINGEVRADRAANGGKLTGAEKAQVNRQQNGVSKRIYTDRHNAAQDHFGNSEVGQRQRNQQNRIANGIKSGKLNAGETENLENREAGVNQEVRADRSTNGGKLTPGERASVNGQQNHLSNSIYKDKHN